MGDLFMSNKIFVVYCSPSGSTRKLARKIERTLADQSVEVNLLDLSVSHNRSAILDLIGGAGEGDCLFVGSPVYRDVAVPPVAAFIESLPSVEGVAAVPFVTWGAVTSGIALWQMGRALVDKGFVLAGAAAVVAEHCMMWRSEAPSGAGRPDSEDEKHMEGFTLEVLKRLRAGDVAPLDLGRLQYHSQALVAEMKQKIGNPWQIVPKTVDGEKCTECGVCAEECPVEAISLDPQPVFDENCFDCFNCVRLCPEEAISSPLTAEVIEKHIAGLKEKYGEPPETKVFLS